MAGGEDAVGGNTGGLKSRGAGIKMWMLTDLAIALRHDPSENVGMAHKSVPCSNISTMQSTVKNTTILCRYCAGFIR